MERRPLPLPFPLTISAAFLFAALWSPTDPAVASAGPARPSLLSISAPTDAGVRAVGVWYDQHVPVKFRARQAVSVSLLTDADMTLYLRSGAAGDGADADGGDGDIDGVFENGPPTITLRLPADGALDDLTFAHEYGHYVWFDILSGGDRRRYRAIYDRRKAAGGLVSDYAAASVEEGFAEAFSYDVGQPATLARRDPLSFAFLAQWPGR